MALQEGQGLEASGSRSVLCKIITGPSGLTFVFMSSPVKVFIKSYLQTWYSPSLPSPRKGTERKGWQRS